MQEVKLFNPKRVGWFTWETVVETPTCKWYFRGWTKEGSRREAFNHFKELSKENNRGSRS